jgi:hypothetical protein
MRWLIALAAVFLLGSMAQAGEKKAVHLRFKKDDMGKVPAGWEATQTNKGDNSSIWKVVADDTAPSGSGYVLAQTAESPGKVFNLCIASDTKVKDIEAIVAFKAIKGKNDQGGGIVWRYQDANNYYVARMNPLEDNYRVYKVVNGVRTQLGKEKGTKEGLKVPAGEWHTLKIKNIGNRIECFLDGKKELDVTDDTFQKPGKVGLWTKADAQTCFDQLVIQSKD